MRKVLEEIGHSPTLVVDEQKSNNVRVEVDSQTQDIGLDSLRLPGSRCPRNQPVRSVSLFMQVEVDQVFLAPQADRHCQALIRRILLPLLQDLQV